MFIVKRKVVKVSYTLPPYLSTILLSMSSVVLRLCSAT